MSTVAASWTVERVTGAHTKFTADRTRIGRVTRINVNHVDTRPTRFVLNEGLQLAECPRLVDVALAFADLGPLADVRQVFQSDGVSWSQRAHDLLADAMVHVAHPALLSTRQPSEHPLGRGCAFTLEIAAPLLIHASNVHRLQTTELNSCTGAGEVGDPHVHPHDLALAASGVRSGTFLGQHDVDVEVPLAFAVVERGCGGLLSGQQTALVVADVQADLVPACRGTDADAVVVAHTNEAEQVAVQIKRRGLEQLGSATLALGGLDRPAHAGETATDVVGSQTVSFFERVVTGVNYSVLKRRSLSFQVSPLGGARCVDGRQ